MSANKRRPAAIAAGLLALAALTGCSGEPSVASKSAAAFREAQKEGKTFEGAGHGHGDHGHQHGSPAPAEAHEMPSAEGEGGEHHHGTAPEGDHSAMGHGGGQQTAEHDHAGHSQPAAPGHGHTGHSQAMPGHEHAAPRPAAPAQDHSGHSHSGGGTATAPAAELPAQPAGILRPDLLDAPAATSVLDAQRSAELAQGMSGGHGGHGGHGAGTYRHVDAGRGPGAYEGSEPQTPGAGPQHHDHGAIPQEEKQEAALYVCPMHPEVTSRTPGTCPKCGMALVERREE